MTGERGGHIEEPKDKDAEVFAGEIFESLPSDLQEAFLRERDEFRSKPEDYNEGDE